MKKYNTRDFLSWYNSIVKKEHKESWSLNAHEIHTLFDDDGEGDVKVSKYKTKSGHTEGWC